MVCGDAGDWLPWGWRLDGGRHMTADSGRRLGTSILRTSAPDEIPTPGSLWSVRCKQSSCRSQKPAQRRPRGSRCTRVAGRAWARLGNCSRSCRGNEGMNRGGRPYLPVWSLRRTLIPAKSARWSSGFGAAARKAVRQECRIRASSTVFDSSLENAGVLVIPDCRAG